MFGHLSVEGLRKEIKVLAGEVAKLRPSPVAKPRVSEVEDTPTTTKLRLPLKRKTHLDPAHHHTQSLSKSPVAGPLTGLRVIVTHCKEPAPGFDLQGAPTIADYIVRQLKYGVGNLGPDETGVEYVAAHQGDEFGKLFLFGSKGAGWAGPVKGGV